jgi:hypothetical protein
MKVHVKGYDQPQEVLGYSSKSFAIKEAGTLGEKTTWVVKPVMIIKERGSNKILAIDLEEVEREG